jgi:hypothetical protein
LTGTVAAEIARQAISSNRPNGIYWAYEVLPIDFVNQYTFSNQYDFYEEKYIEIKNDSRYATLSTSYTDLSEGEHYEKVFI